MKSSGRVLYLSLSVLMILLVSCNPTPKRTEASLIKPEISVRNPIVKKEPKIYRPEINYSQIELKSRKQIDSLLNSFSEEDKETILALNRVQANRIRPNNALIIPECTSANFIDYSPFPSHMEEIKCMPKAVLISRRVQAFALYEQGELVKWGPVSTGKNSTKTPAGLNYGNYKAKRKISTVDPSWVLPYYFNFMNFEGIGVHQYALPGYPASHGCVRLQMKDAKYIYDWASNWKLEQGDIEENGTPFMVFGEYDYNNDKPWLQLKNDMKANDLNQDEINTIKTYVNRYQNDPKNFGDKEAEAIGQLASK
ncbi:L,D-transpeptidase [Christiangramia salexigens]|uniref:L,D-transpeptidase n=1 Tax=Christiangramia salexigens TaxID=1913577 RepID=A0A1L3J1Y7_9FLAO|nr:L,D-transpeptidase [Christiangramia salexigens]APG59144.1 L,D-transpeptidase [Christiangramia salexigens]